MDRSQRSRLENGGKYRKKNKKSKKRKSKKRKNPTPPRSTKRRPTSRKSSRRHRRHRSSRKMGGGDYSWMDHMDEDELQQNYQKELESISEAMLDGEEGISNNVRINSINLTNNCNEYIRRLKEKGIDAEPVVDLEQYDRILKTMECKNESRTRQPKIICKITDAI